MKLYLQRHAHTDDGPQMDADRPINDIGEKQAKAMRAFFKMADIDPDVIICSDFKRARQTAEIMQRHDTPIKTTPFLRPEVAEDSKDVASAWKSIIKLAGDAKCVHVITHGPLIQRLLASVAFCFVDEKWDFEHGACAYINTNESRFRWFITPKLAAHLTDKYDPKDVETPVAEAFARDTIALAEHLRRERRATALNPLIAQVKAASAKRFGRQKLRVLKAIKPYKRAIDLGSANYSEVKQAVRGAIPFQDPKFAKLFNSATTAAHATGYTHAGEMLNLFYEAKRTEILPPPSPSRTADDLEDELDDTTDDEITGHINAGLDVSKPLTYAAILEGIRQSFRQYSIGTEGRRSRSDTIALNEISRAYHDGGSKAVEQAPGAVEKQWDIGPEGCTACQDNADDGWIPSDDIFSSGDGAPPLHPNCDCSINYRTAEE